MSFKCRGCAGENVVPVVDLGAQPCADYFPTADAPGPDPRWPLELWLCRDCTLVQLGPVEPQLPEPPLAVESATSIAHAEQSVKGWPVTANEPTSWSTSTASHTSLLLAT